MPPVDTRFMTTPMRSLLAISVALAAVALPSSVAAAAPPVIKSVSPLKAKVGQQLTVKGTGFLRGANRNTVIFMSDRGPTSFVKVPSATTTTMVVPLPSKLESGMRKSSDGRLLPNRFQLRAVANEPADSFTPKSMSPVISPRSSAPPPPPDPARDTDGDRLPDVENPNTATNEADEKQLGTDPRLRDTDGDGLEDGWEYYSARDLNARAVPYPGERPFPNALDPSDADVDYDGDFLKSGEEHALWVYAGRRFDDDPGRLAAGNSPLWYSDGTQTSTPTQSGGTPDFQRPNYPGLYDESQWPEPTYPAELDRDGDNVWSDDERDADRDGLSNITEGHLMSAWNRILAKCDPPVKPWEDNKQGAYYGSFGVRPFAEPSMLDPDSDGDGLLDAEDDQDNDDVPNYSEMDLECGDEPALIDADSDGEVDDPNPDFEPNVHPYNPCAPYGGYWVPFPGTPMARTCPRYKPLDG